MNIGDRIPEVLGLDQDGNEIKSSDYRGKKDCPLQLSKGKHQRLHR